MGQGNTLWWACCARGVHDAAEVLGLGGNRVHVVFLALLAQILDAHHVEVMEFTFQLIKQLLVHLGIGVIDDVLDRGYAPEDVDERLEQGWVEEDGSASSLD